MAPSYLAVPLLMVLTLALTSIDFCLHLHLISLVNAVITTATQTSFRRAALGWNAVFSGLTWHRAVGHCIYITGTWKYSCSRLRSVSLQLSWDFGHTVSSQSYARCRCGHDRHARRSHSY